ncbi:sensor histidine kinase [Haloarcula litorea]|uniref:sensor histidine kinase n=1 Tax=Haloarcula litorea TaxID=3032579 RepID=UPI0023E84DBB|nr:HAMP domain-containing sensor histidine kinase [Halomicroarcula sp. GDY20]
MRADRWRRVVPLVLVGLVGVAAAAQLVVLPRRATPLSVAVVAESTFLLVVLGSLAYVATARQLAGLSRDESGAADVYPPVVTALGLFLLTGTTDLLDEFLRYPISLHTLLEDGSMIVGVGLLMVGIGRWATVRKRHEEVLRGQRDRLDRQNERLDTFAGIVSHDLQNPLSVAAGHLELYRQNGEPAHLDRVEEAHERMGALVDDVLALARVGPDAVEPEPVALGAIARDAWDSVDPDAGSLRVDVPEGTTVRADPDYLRQLLENLVRNSAQHATADRPDEGADGSGTSLTVRVGVGPDGFAVADDGPGIPPAERDDVFDPGYSTDEDGTGFGLHIVREVADAHGWSVSVDDSESGGARFELRGVDVDRETATADGEVGPPAA